ncbi:unnamed protein product [Mytilus coruscus]|uniref:Reverse transcriptase domain-containing protein n=1 Tax=Mytilus coruscus TaxID=42192 RepID=A0A6J8EJF8_MYTCO|nr:unnamed protein product [Mytilus coruscus]
MVLNNEQAVDEYLGMIELNKSNEEDWSVLNQFISKKECLDNIKDLENNKSPGIDGLGKGLWIKIRYKDIKSKIQVNGMLTEEILITRSVRQGCPLSMNLYALAIETFANSIRTNKNIKGINIPNLKEPIQLFQHVDDCTTITTDIKDYSLFMNEFEKFGKASGANIARN